MDSSGSHSFFHELARLRRESGEALLGSRCAVRLRNRALADAQAALDDLRASGPIPRLRKS